ALDRHRDRRVHELPEPELEHEEREEDVLLPALPLVLADERQDGLGLEDPAPARPRIEQDVLEEAREAAPEPVGDRDPEAHLPPLEDRLRQAGAEGPLQDELPAEPPELLREGEPRDL